MSTVTFIAEPVDLSAFGHDPLWLVIAKALVIFVFLLLTTLIAIYVERKVMARMQMRVGPNRVGPRGLLQSLADGVKLALKEGITPSGVDKPIYMLAPIIAVVPAFMAFAVSPLRPRSGRSSGTVVRRCNSQTFPSGVLYILAVTSVGVYGIVLAGWSSRIDLVRCSALFDPRRRSSRTKWRWGLSFAAVFLYAGTMSTSGIVSAQEGSWYVLSAPLPSFLIYGSCHGRRNKPRAIRPSRSRRRTGRRIPYRVLWSLKFAMFMLAEYVNMVTVSALGHDTLPRRLARTVPVRISGTAQIRGGGRCCGSSAKSWFFLFIFIWLRSTLPRFALRPVHERGWKITHSGGVQEVVGHGNRLRYARFRNAGVTTPGWC